MSYVTLLAISESGCIDPFASPIHFPLVKDYVTIDAFQYTP